MRQILGSVKIKRIDRINQSLTVPLEKYKIRQSNYLCDDNDLTFRYPVVGSDPAFVNKGPAKKRMKMDLAGTAYFPSGNLKNSIDARTECAVYGREMLSYAISAHHAIVCLIMSKCIRLYSPSLSFTKLCRRLPVLGLVLRQTGCHSIRRH
jgi:hypothetical protein